MAANDGSRGLAYLSTASYVDRLIFCVRYGYRSFPVAVAAMDLNEREMKKKDERRTDAGKDHNILKHI